MHTGHRVPGHEAGAYVVTFRAIHMGGFTDRTNLLLQPYVQLRSLLDDFAMALEVASPLLVCLQAAARTRGRACGAARCASAWRRRGWRWSSRGWWRWAGGTREAQSASVPEGVRKSVYKAMETLVRGYGGGAQGAGGGGLGVRVRHEAPVYRRVSGSCGNAGGGGTRGVRGTIARRQGFTEHWYCACCEKAS